MLTAIGLWVVLACPGQDRLIPPEGVRVTLVRVLDGDTLACRFPDFETRSVGLALVDAPELGQRPWGPLARVWLTERITPGEFLYLETDPELPADPYGRVPAYVYPTSRDGQKFGDKSLNELIARQGLAYWWCRGDQPALRHQILEAEGVARINRQGIWGGTEPGLFPWCYRRIYRAGREPNFP